MAEGFALHRDEGTTIAYLGGLATFKITTEETGSWGVSVETFPAGFASALHVHHSEDSGFFILRGHMRVKYGDVELEAGPEGFIFLPRGIPHAFKVVSDEPATWINVQGPTGHFRRYVEEIGVGMDRPTWPPPTPDIEPRRRTAAAERYQLEVVGPPPFDIPKER